MEGHASNLIYSIKCITLDGSLFKKLLISVTENMSHSKKVFAYFTQNFR